MLCTLRMIHGSLIADLETERVMLLSALAIGVALCTVFHLVHTGSATAQEVNREKREQLEKAVEQALPDARAFANQLRSAIDAAAQSAGETARKGEANVYRFEQSATAGRSGDPSSVEQQIPAFAMARQSTLTEIPPLLVLASLSMPDASLKPLIEDMARAGGIVVLRGFYEGSVSATTTRLKALVDDGEQLAGVSIDPNVFSLYEAEFAPTFIVPAEPVLPCEAPNCTQLAPAHDKLIGNVSLAYALGEIANKGDVSQDRAKAYLQRLEASE